MFYRLKYTLARLFSRRPVPYRYRGYRYTVTQHDQPVQHTRARREW